MEETNQGQAQGFAEQGHVIVTEAFEAVLFPSGFLLAQGDNVVRLTPHEALAIAGAISLGYAPGESENAEPADTPDE